MKAILVIDEMPTDCIKCPLANGYCWNTFPAKGKADGCPLKPLPEKEIENGETEWNYYVQGWNACIEEITK